MNKHLLCLVLVAATPPAWSQTKPASKAAAARIDPCAPIGQTANRELIYSINCNKPPAQPPQPQAEVQQAPESEVQRGGLFGMSFDRSDGPTGQGRNP